MNHSEAFTLWCTWIIAIPSLLACQSFSCIRSSPSLCCLSRNQEDEIFMYNGIYVRNTMLTLLCRVHCNEFYYADTCLSCCHCPVIHQGALWPGEICRCHASTHELKSIIPSHKYWTAPVEQYPITFPYSCLWLCAVYICKLRYLKCNSLDLLVICPALCNVLEMCYIKWLDILYTCPRNTICVYVLICVYLIIYI